MYSGLAKACEKESRYRDAADSYMKARQYAGTGEEMEVLYNLANLYEHQFKDYPAAAMAFQNYRLSLFNYQMNLKDPVEVEAIEEKLKALDEHIRELKMKN